MGESGKRGRALEWKKGRTEKKGRDRWSEKKKSSAFVFFSFLLSQIPYLPILGLERGG